MTPPRDDHDSRDVDRPPMSLEAPNMTESTILDPNFAAALDAQIRLIERVEHDIWVYEFTPIQMFTVLGMIKEPLVAMRWKPSIEAGVPPAACVPLEEYREEDYRYYENIADDPMWGVNANYEFPYDDTGYGIGCGDKLGYHIRITPRTPEGLKVLNRMRDWHAECRAFGLYPGSGAAENYNIREAFGAYQDALEQALTDDERAAAKATFTQIMRDAVAEDEAHFACDLEDRALGRNTYDWPEFDRYAARRAKWAKTPAGGVIDASNATTATNPIDATNAADHE